jgi:hypothetical protein
LSVPVPADLTSESIDALLEQSRQELERRVAKYGPDAIDVLHEVATSAQPGRVSKDDREWMKTTLALLGLDVDEGTQAELLIEIRTRFCRAPAAARVNAAKEIVAQVRPQPKAEAPAQVGPSIHVVIEKLYAGGSRELVIPVSGAVMDAIEAGPILDDDAG